jgi:glycosyltransferase involved in cell wall biosynthesis
MKVLQVIPYFAEKHGGDVNICYNLSKRLAKKHEVTVITTDFGGGRGTDIKVEYFKCVAFKLFLYSPAMKKWVRKNLKEFDIVHLHTYRSYQNNIIHFYAKKYNIPYILQAHGSISPYFTLLKGLYDTVWGYRIIKDATRLIALTEGEVHQYERMGAKRDKIEIIPNGIDPNKYIPKKGGFRKKYGIDERMILYLGRLHKSKGIDLLLKAFAPISNAKLVIVGPDDGYRSALEELAGRLRIKERTLFTGFIRESEKMQALVDADVFVTPRFFGFPVTFLESCLCGTPIITTNDGDRLDWIDEVGFVVEYGEEGLREAIIKVLENPKKRGRELVKERFSWEKICRRFEETYRRCL